MFFLYLSIHCTEVDSLCCNSKREEARKSLLFSNCNNNKKSRQRILIFGQGQMHRMKQLLMIYNSLFSSNIFSIKFVLEFRSSLLQSYTFQVLSILERSWTGQPFGHIRIKNEASFWQIILHIK